MLLHHRIGMVFTISGSSNAQCGNSLLRKTTELRCAAARRPCAISKHTRDRELLLLTLERMVFDLDTD